MKEQIVIWFQNKLNLVLTIFAGLFVLLALLSYLWAPLASVSMIFGSLAVFLFAVKFYKKYKQNKSKFYDELATGKITKNQEKQKKLALRQQKWQAILIYLLSLAMIIFVIKQILSLWF